MHAVPERAGSAALGLAVAGTDGSALARRVETRMVGTGSVRTSRRILRVGLASQSRSESLHGSRLAAQ